MQQMLLPIHKRPVMYEHGFFLNDWQKNYLQELYPGEQEKIKVQSGQVFFNL